LTDFVTNAADENAWQSNDEFAREFLAGLNPVVIQLVEVKNSLPLIYLLVL
jgi:hypothetical protein